MDFDFIPGFCHFYSETVFYILKKALSADRSKNNIYILNLCSETIFPEKMTADPERSAFFKKKRILPEMSGSYDFWYFLPAEKALSIGFPNSQ
jgi:hypothetical protein